MPQEAPSRQLIVYGNATFVYIIHNNVLDPVRLLRQDPAAVIFHHLMGPRLEESGVGPSLFAGYGILGLVPVAQAGGGRQDRHLIDGFSADAIQAVFDPLGLQSAFLFVVHMPEVTAAAFLRHRALPVHPVGGFFQDLGDLPRRPGLPGLLDTHQDLLPGDGIGDEHSTPFNVGNSLSFRGIVRDFRLVNLIFQQHWVSPSHLVPFSLYDSIIRHRGKAPLACFSKKC